MQARTNGSEHGFGSEAQPLCNIPPLLTLDRAVAYLRTQFRHPHGPVTSWRVLDDAEALTSEFTARESGIPATRPRQLPLCPPIEPRFGRGRGPLALPPYRHGVAGLAGCVVDAWIGLRVPRWRYRGSFARQAIHLLIASQRFWSA